MKKYLLSLSLLIIVVMFIFTGCPSNPSHPNSNNPGSTSSIILQGFQKPGDAVSNLVMTSGDRLYIGWSAVKNSEITTSTFARVYVSAYDGKSFNPLGDVVGNVSYSLYFSGISLFRLGVYNNNPVIAMVDAVSGGIIVKQWTTGLWATIGTLPLADISDTVVALSKITVTANNLYIAYGERLTTGATVIKVYQFNGSNWQALPSPAVIPSGSYLFSVDMALLNNNPVIVWITGSDSTGKETIPVSMWNGSQWVSLSDNLKFYNSSWLMGMGSASGSITSIPDGVAVMWNEGMPFTDSSGMMLDLPVGMVATYNDVQWTWLGTVNRDEPRIATDARDAEQLNGLWFNSRLYIAFVEMAQVYLAYYNINGFGYIGDSLNAHPYALTGNPLYGAMSPSLAQYNGKIYLSFIERMVDQSTMTISDNPYIREIMP
ncbi:MAG: hypothetical protein ACP5JP_08435 [bacterium]